MVSPAHGLRPAVFLDRDGVIVVPEFRDRRSFAPRRLQDFRLYPEAAASLQKLKRAGFLLAVVTNQPDVGNGLMSRSEVEAMHEIMRRELPLDAIKVCFHGQAEGCEYLAQLHVNLFQMVDDAPCQDDGRSWHRRQRGEPSPCHGIVKRPQVVGRLGGD